jgi:hypothetical protein
VAGNASDGGLILGMHPGQTVQVFTWSVYLGCKCLTSTVYSCWDLVLFALGTGMSETCPLTKGSTASGSAKPISGSDSGSGSVFMYSGAGSRSASCVAFR